MPIHSSWKSMAEGMRGQKAYAKGEMKCRPFTDGSKVCMRAKAWQVFFALINKMGADETKPRPKVKTGEATKKVNWFLEARGLNDVMIPKWVPLAKNILSSPKFNKKVKAFWESKLRDWCKKNPKYNICGDVSE